MQGLLDFDVMEDTGIDELPDLNADVACELMQILAAKGKPKWGKCTEVATHWVKISCRCGRSKRILLCLSCTQFTTLAFGVAAKMFMFMKSLHGCRRPRRFTVTNGSLS